MIDPLAHKSVDDDEGLGIDIEAADELIPPIHDVVHDALKSLESLTLSLTQISGNSLKRGGARNHKDVVQREFAAYKNYIDREIEHFGQELMRYNTIQKLNYEKLAKQTYLNTFAMQLASEQRQERIFPVSIYISDETNAAGTINAVERLVSLLEGVVVERFTPVLASFWQRLWYKTSPKTKDEILNTTRMLKKATEIQTVGIPRSEEVKNYADAISVLQGTLEHCESAAILVQSLLLIKRTVDGKPHTIIKTLAEEEVLFLQMNPHFLNEPHKILEGLEETVPLQVGAVKLISSDQPFTRDA